MDSPILFNLKAKENKMPSVMENLPRTDDQILILEEEETYFQGKLSGTVQIMCEPIYSPEHRKNCSLIYFIEQPEIGHWVKRWKPLPKYARTKKEKGNI